MNLDFLMYICLNFSNHIGEAVLLTLFYGKVIEENKETYQKLFCFMLVMVSFMAINAGLKNLFNVTARPGAPSYGLAFPSGHMSIAFYIYTYIILRCGKQLYFLLGGVALMLASISIYYFQYHHYNDMIVGAIFGFLYAFAYWYISTYHAHYAILYTLFCMLLQLVISIAFPGSDYSSNYLMALIGVNILLICSMFLFYTAKHKMLRYILSFMFIIAWLYSGLLVNYTMHYSYILHVNEETVKQLISIYFSLFGMFILAYLLNTAILSIFFRGKATLTAQQ